MLEALTAERWWNSRSSALRTIPKRSTVCSSICSATAPRMADEQSATVACHACLHVLRSGRLRSSGSIEAIRSTVPETFLGCVVSHPSYGARGRALGSAVAFLVLRGSFLFWYEKGAEKKKKKEKKEGINHVFCALRVLSFEGRSVK